MVTRRRAACSLRLLLVLIRSGISLFRAPENVAAGRLSANIDRRNDQATKQSCAYGQKPADGACTTLSRGSN
jgi:hypothetical protein